MKRRRGSAKWLWRLFASWGHRQSAASHWYWAFTSTCVAASHWYWAFTSTCVAASHWYWAFTSTCVAASHWYWAFTSTCDTNLQAIPLQHVTQTLRLYRFNIWHKPLGYTTSTCDTNLQAIPLQHVTQTFRLYHFNMWHKPSGYTTSTCDTNLEAIPLQHVTQTFMLTVSLVLGFHFNRWYKPLRWQSFFPCLFLHLLSNNPITMVKFLCWIKWQKDEWIKMYCTDTFHVRQFGPAARHRASQQTNVSSRSLSSKTWGSYTVCSDFPPRN